jgi:hypothetical protein
MVTINEGPSIIFVVYIRSIFYYEASLRSFLEGLVDVLASLHTRLVSRLVRGRESLCILCSVRVRIKTSNVLGTQRLHFIC